MSATPTSPAPSPLASELPPRFTWRAGVGLLVTLLAVWGATRAFQLVGVSWEAVASGLPQLKEILLQLIPTVPSASWAQRLSGLLAETFLMALVGTTIGALISFPLALCAAKNLSPHPVIYAATRAFVSFTRTVPDLVWAILFVVAVGLGPFAGTLTIVVDAIGFCTRFFAEAIEESDPGPSTALRFIGAGRISTFFCAILPQCLPSFIATTLFSLEKATRHSVVLGLVGAGGIGIELKVALDLFRFGEAASIILGVFVLVLLVERVSAILRSRMAS